MYDNGFGVPENYVRAYAWYSIAAAQGNDEARTNKEIVAQCMTLAQVAQGQNFSSLFWEKYVLPSRYNNAHPNTGLPTQLICRTRSTPRCGPALPAWSRSSAYRLRLR